jgi:hypothetical protein
LRLSLAARSGRSSERLSDEELGLFAAELRAQVADSAEPATEIEMTISQQSPAKRRKESRMGAGRCPDV